MVIKKPLCPGLIAVALISTIVPTAPAQTPCPDADMDGWAVCDAVCQLDPGDQCGDCDDGNPNRYPGNPDVCDGLDNDCDGPADEDFPEVGQVCTADVGACEGIGITVCGGAGVGTFMVKDINPGPGDGAVQSPANLNGVLLFFADDGTHGSEPWISDGSEQGTVLLKDINPGPGGSLVLDTYDLRFTNVGGTVLLQARGDLWKSDGTEKGTVFVKDPGWTVRHLTEVDGTLFFIAAHGELWKSDGTDAGTILLRDFSNSTDNPNDSNGDLWSTHVGPESYFPHLAPPGIAW